MKKIFLLVIIFMMNFSTVRATKILYIPLDNRPCNFSQVIQVAEKAGYELITPPDELLGTRENIGDPDKLWQWLEENALVADAAVLSTDSLMYGSLIASRRHNISPELIRERVQRFSELDKKFPFLKIYTFGTVMRTPRSATHSSAEPEYYKTYGAQIFQYTALLDKEESNKLSKRERNQLKTLSKEIPKEYIDDWFGRRAANFSANKYLIDLTRAGAFEYLLLGCDDSAKFSQTHKESRHLTEYSADLGKTVVQITSGADELGMLMISRAINHDKKFMPFVSVEYNIGKGEKTFPSYCNESIGISIDAAIIAAGAMKIPAHERADLVLAINTRENGKDLPAGEKKNTIHLREDLKIFLGTVENFLAKDYPVAIGDISFFNGADNALMNQLQRRNLQYKLRAYSGWNTATNSTGFLIGAGTLTKFMNDRDVADLLTMRYLDDWAYQANIRQEIFAESYSLTGEGDPLNLKEKLPPLEIMLNEKMNAFAMEHLHLPNRYHIKNLRVKLPWQRTFECDPSFNFEYQ